MICEHCSFELPENWPLTKITELLSGLSEDVLLCVPCQHKITNVSIKRDDLMTPWERR